MAKLMGEERGGNTSDGGLEMVRNRGRSGRGSMRLSGGFSIGSKRGRRKRMCAAGYELPALAGGEGEKREEEEGRERTAREIWWSRRSAATGDRGERSDRWLCGWILAVAARLVGEDEEEEADEGEKKEYGRWLLFSGVNGGGRRGREGMG
ncbi:hypothetical protein HAX54_049561, partial [Datura stramonium]|nr:hypothetical protein [Datura stramonium]